MSASSWTSHFSETQRALSDMDISNVETKLGIPLPDALRRLYSTVGGGTFNRLAFKRPDGMLFDDIDQLLSKDELVDTYNAAVVKGDMPSHLVPFAVGGCGDYYCIDRRDGAVVFFATEIVDRREKRVADSLDAFFDGLRVDDGDD